jgi:hypothetical protein
VKREIPYLVCDVCDRSELDDPTLGIETHRITFDGVTIEADVCKTDTDGLLATFAVFAKHGRQVPTKTKIVGAKPFPGTSWRFSSHALIRLGERKIDPTEILPVLDDPTLTRPGNASDLQIRERGRLKAVVAPERGIVITVARSDEADGDMSSGTGSRTS